MGCGASHLDAATTALQNSPDDGPGSIVDPVANGVSNGDSIVAGAAPAPGRSLSKTGSHTSSRKVRTVAAPILLQMGSKKVQNSFIISKHRSFKRESELDRLSSAIVPEAATLPGALLGSGKLLLSEPAFGTPVPPSPTQHNLHAGGLPPLSCPPGLPPASSLMLLPPIGRESLLQLPPLDGVQRSPTASMGASAGAPSFAALKSRISKHMVFLGVEAELDKGTAHRRIVFALPLDDTLEEGAPARRKAARRLTNPAPRTSAVRLSLQQEDGIAMVLDRTSGASTAQSEDFSDAFRGQPEDFARHCAALASGAGEDPALVEAVVFFRKFSMSKDSESVPRLRKEAVLPGLVRQLTSTSPAIQLEAAWAITNVCSHAHEEVAYAVESGAVEAFVGLLHTSTSEPLLEQVLWGLGNVAADASTLHHRLLKKAVVMFVLAAAKAAAGGTSQVVRNAAWLLANLTRSSPLAPEVQAAVLPFLASTVQTSADPEAQAHAAWALAYLVASAPTARLAVSEQPELLALLVSWMRGTTGPTPAPAVRVIQLLCGGTPAEAQTAIAAGAVEALLRCAQSTPHSGMRGEVVTALTSVALRGNSEVVALFREGAFDVLVQLLRSPDTAIRTRCVVALSSPWVPSVQLVEGPARLLLERGLVEELCTRWVVSEPADTVLAALEGVGNALRKGQRIMMSSGHAVLFEAQKEAAREGLSNPFDVGAKAAAEAPGNPVAALVHAPATVELLKQLHHHPDTRVVSKAQSLLNLLQFMA